MSKEFVETGQTFTEAGEAYCPVERRRRGNGGARRFADGADRRRLFFDLRYVRRAKPCAAESRFGRARSNRAG